MGLKSRILGEFLGIAGAVGIEILVFCGQFLFTQITSPILIFKFLFRLYLVLILDGLDVGTVPDHSNLKSENCELDQFLDRLCLFVWCNLSDLSGDKMFLIRVLVQQIYRN